MAKLPITSFRQQIVETIRQNSVVIITADTGAGKSTQVPQFLLEEGWNIVVTQPRRLAAQSVAQRVAEEMGEKLGRRVGYRTSDARVDSAETQCLFCTDGLALVRELMQNSTYQILIIDEVHEWNTNIEVLIAWTKQQIDKGANYKLVLMSATLESEALSSYFHGAPIISVPGKMFPVTEIAPGESIESDAVQLLRRGRHVLIFQPGKAEIRRTVEALKAQLGSQAEVLPLHGDLSPQEQAGCFKHPAKPTCIVATNIAQTSVTVPFIDAVIDSGEERRVELAYGIEGLYVRTTSMADRNQRKGRAGRVKNGIYIDHCSASRRSEFPKAEILRSRLDQLVLRFASIGIDLGELTFFHQPDLEEIREDRKILRFLRCIDDEGRVTELGQRIAMLPISVRCGRMLVEAESLGVVDDTLTLIAILEGGEITDRKNLVWRRICPDEKSSDLFAQLAVYKVVDGLPAGDLSEYGVINSSFAKIKALRTKLVRATTGRIAFSESAEPRLLLKAMCAGWLDSVYYSPDFGRLYSTGRGFRTLSYETVLRNPEWVIGLPWDVETRDKGNESSVRRLLQHATKLDEETLRDLIETLDLDLTEIEWIHKGIVLPGGKRVAIQSSKAVIEKRLAPEPTGLFETARQLKLRLQRIHETRSELGNSDALAHQVEVFRFSLLPKTENRLAIWIHGAKKVIVEAEAKLPVVEQQSDVPTSTVARPLPTATSNPANESDSSVKRSVEIQQIELALGEVDLRLRSLHVARQSAKNRAN